MFFGDTVYIAISTVVVVVDSDFISWYLLDQPAR